VASGVMQTMTAPGFLQSNRAQHMVFSASAIASGRVIA
jgi:hypothetical protein